MTPLQPLRLRGALRRFWAHLAATFERATDDGPHFCACPDESLCVA